MQVQYVAIYYDGTKQWYSLWPRTNNWGFGSCTNLNGVWLNFWSTHPAAKDWLALVLTAKATGQTVRIWTDGNCTAPTILEIDVQ